MVLKHKTKAGFEQLEYGPLELKECWNKALEDAKMLVEPKLTSYDLLTFIEWIQNTNYSKLFFPGFSMGTLLISKPKDRKLNYQQTLSIQYYRENSMFKLSYSDWDTIERKEDREQAILWEHHCPGSALSQEFLEFIKWNKNWC